MSTPILISFISIKDILRLKTLFLGTKPHKFGHSLVGNALLLQQMTNKAAPKSKEAPAQAKAATERVIAEEAVD